MLKRAFEAAGLSNKAARNLEIAPVSVSIEAKGIQGDGLIEPVPNFIQRRSDNTIKGANNTWIVLGRDRPGELGSGYGAETGAGTIDLVVGRMSSNIQTLIPNDATFKSETVSIDNSLAYDASRIYISQKTDVDKNFNLADGMVGISEAKAAIAIKSDAIRLIAREGIKIITKADRTNSQGGDLISIPGIDLIAGNGTGEEQQPIVKGDNLNKFFSDIVDRIDELNSVVDMLITAQAEFNSILGSHTHPDFFAMMYGINGGFCPFSHESMQGSVKAGVNLMLAKKDGIMNKLKIKVNSDAGNTSFGTETYISKNVTVS